jgi:hypothetical protein
VFWLDGFTGEVVDGVPTIGTKDGIAQAGELLGRDPATKAPIPLIVGGAINPLFESLCEGYDIGYSGFTPYSSETQPSPYTVDPNAGSSRAMELLASVDHELLQDFSVGLNFTYRKYDHFTWNPAYYTDGYYGDYSIGGESLIRNIDMYSVAGQIPTSGSFVDHDGNPVTVDLGEGAGKDYYLMTSGYGYTPYAYHLRNTNYETFWGVTLVMNKRLSNKWMLDGSFSYQDQRYHYGDGVTNPTNLWALDNHLYAPYIGGASGKISNYIFSHWMFKLEGLYQLPWGFNVSFTFNAREGHFIPHYMGITDYTWSNDYNQGVTVYLDPLGSTTLPTFYQLNARIEKLIKLGDTGRIYLMADAFNVLNTAVINRRYDQNEGTYYYYGAGDPANYFAPYAHTFEPNEILNPFIARLGVRFQF